MAQKEWETFILFFLRAATQSKGSVLSSFDRQFFGLEKCRIYFLNNFFFSAQNRKDEWLVDRPTAISYFRSRSIDLCQPVLINSDGKRKVYCIII